MLLRTNSKYIPSIVWTLLSVNVATIILGGLITWLGYAIPTRLNQFGLEPSYTIAGGFASLLVACLGLCALNYSSHRALRIYSFSCALLILLMLIGIIPAEWYNFSLSPAPLVQQKQSSRVPSLLNATDQIITFAPDEAANRTAEANSYTTTTTTIQPNLDRVTSSTATAVGRPKHHIVGAIIYALILLLLFVLVVFAFILAQYFRRDPANGDQDNESSGQVLDRFKMTGNLLHEIHSLNSHSRLHLPASSSHESNECTCGIGADHWLRQRNLDASDPAMMLSRSELIDSSTACDHQSIGSQRSSIPLSSLTLPRVLRVHQCQRHANCVSASKSHDHHRNSRSSKFTLDNRQRHDQDVASFSYQTFHHRRQHHKQRQSSTDMYSDSVFNSKSPLVNKGIYRLASSSTATVAASAATKGSGHQTEAAASDTNQGDEANQPRTRLADSSEPNVRRASSRSSAANCCGNEIGVDENVDDGGNLDHAPPPEPPDEMLQDGNEPASIMMSNSYPNEFNAGRSQLNHHHHHHHHRHYHNHRRHNHQPSKAGLAEQNEFNQQHPAYHSTRVNLESSCSCNLLNDYTSRSIQSLARARANESESRACEPDFGRFNGDLSQWLDESRPGHLTLPRLAPSGVLTLKSATKKRNLAKGQSSAVVAATAAVAAALLGGVVQDSQLFGQYDSDAGRFEGDFCTDDELAMAIRDNGNCDFDDDNHDFIQDADFGPEY